MTTEPAVATPRTAQGERQTTPWAALLLEVRRSAFRVEVIDMRLGEVMQREGELLHEAEHTDPAVKQLAAEVQVWLGESRKERAHLARVSKAALDAGISKLLVEAQELEVASMRRVLTAGLDAVELEPEVRAQIVRGFQAELARVEHERLPGSDSRTLVRQYPSVPVTPPRLLNPAIFLQSSEDEPARGDTVQGELASPPDGEDEKS
jgi:hypothetical protein